LFAELNRDLLNGNGRAGIIVPTGIATDHTTRFFFQDIVNTGTLASLYDFENREAIFPGVHRSYKFSLLTLTGSDKPVLEADFLFFALRVSDLRDDERHFTLSAADIGLINPNTQTAPIFRYRKDAELTKGIYGMIPAFVVEGENEVNAWEVYYLRLVDYSDYASELHDLDRCRREGYQQAGNQWYKEDTILLPVYESKLINIYDHRFATYESTSDVHEPSVLEKNRPSFSVQPRYWVTTDFFTHTLMAKYPEYDNDWFLSYRDVARSTDIRTLISTVTPRLPASRKQPVLGFNTNRAGHLMLANLNAFVLDFVARQKIGGISMSYFIIKQLPILKPNRYVEPCKWQRGDLLAVWLIPRVLELSCTAYDVHSFALALGYCGPPFPWDEERRFLLRSELDAAYFHLYGIERDDVDYILDTFPIVRRKDEDEYGEYRTKRVILEIYDEMAEAMATGQPYQTRLDPPPAHPDAAHPWDEEYLGPELPRDQWWQEAPPIVEGAKPAAGKKPASKPQRTHKEPAAPYKESEAKEKEVLTLRPPGPAVPEKKKASQALTPTSTTVDVMPAPTGSRSTRLMRAMALGKDLSPLATRELVAFLADEDKSIRWLAGSSLVQRASLDVVSAIAAFLDKAEPERVDVARPEAERVLVLIADTTGDEEVREMAKIALAT
jgi:hypothetical protein